VNITVEFLEYPIGRKKELSERAEALQRVKKIHCIIADPPSDKLSICGFGIKERHTCK